MCFIPFPKQIESLALKTLRIINFLACTITIALRPKQKLQFVLSLTSTLALIEELQKFI